MKKILLCALTFVSATTSVVAQSSQCCPITHDYRQGNSIYGHIIEEDTENDMPYTSIFIVETQQGMTADQYGKFQFTHLPEGEYTLRVQHVGYQQQEVKVKVTDEAPLDMHVKMEEMGFTFDEVVVSASRNEMKRSEAPVIVNVLNTKIFEQTNSADLAKSLNYQSGLRVENNCQNCAFPQVRINGLEGPYSQILINSRPVVSALSGVYGLEQIPTNMIDRIEVVRGGGSALFGANAVGGTINIITKEPVQNSFHVASTISNMGGKAWEEVVNANASLVSSDHVYGVALYESYRNRSPYDRDGDGFSEVGMLNSNTFGINAFYKPNLFGKLNLEYHTTNEFRRGGNKFDYEPFQSDITEQTKHIVNSGGISYDQYFNNYKHKMSLYTSLQHINRNSYYGAQQNPNAYGKTTDLTWVAGGMYVGNFDKLLFAPATLTAGIEYQSNAMHDVMVGYNRDMKQDVKIFGTFAQSEWKMRLFTLLAGLRIDKHNLIEHPILSPRINLMYKPNRNLNARLTWSTGFRAPQAYDEDLHITAVGGEGVLIQLAEGLKPERSNSFSGSIDWIFNLGHWQANLLVEAFYTDLANVFVLEMIGHDTQGNALQERRNGSGARVYGGNLDLKIAHGKDIALQLGFTAQRSQYKKAEYWSENPTVHPIRNMWRTPNYYGYFTLSGNLWRHLDWSLSGIYTGRMYVPHFAPDLSEAPTDYPYTYITQDIMERTPSFFDLNAKLNYTFVLKDHLKLQLNAGVQNILDSFQSDLDQGAYRDSGYFYGPTSPRPYFIGIKIFN